MAVKTAAFMAVKLGSGRAIANREAGRFVGERTAGRNEASRLLL
jgi:hypothetical protein